MKRRVYIVSAIVITMLMAMSSVTQRVTFSQAPGSTQFQVTIDSAAHQTYGLYYPVTYMFQFPSGTGPLTAQYRYSLSDSWSDLSPKTTAEIFNGVNAARFDYEGGTAYLSVAFAANSDTLFLRIIDSQSQEVPITYLGIPLYYDNRRAAVTVSLDDWNATSGVDFNDAATILSRRNIHFTVGVITGQSPDWSLIQQWANSGWMEVASHSRSHPCTDQEYASSGYAYQIAGSRQDILTNLTLTHPYVHTYIEPCGLETPAIRQAIVQAGYLDTRGYPVPPLQTTFSPWGVDGSYQRAMYSSVDTWLWPWYTHDNNLLAQANAGFDAAYAAGGIYHLVDHPWQGRWFWGGTLDSHTQYIANRADVWYAAFGELYLYHFVQERGLVSVSPVGMTGTVVAPTPTATSLPTTAMPPATQTYSLWSDAAVPAITSMNDANAVELGVKFVSAVGGQITGLRFYKGSLNTGTHVGHLWTANGTLLGQVTFTDETASGWQTAYFATPVPIAANTIYVASYHTDAGHYAVTQQYFTAGYYRAPLYALGNSEVSGGNGVYRYGPSAFPDQTYESGNYWVDVVFSTDLLPTSTPVPPTATSAPATATNTPVPPTATATDTPLPATPTNTPVPPTATSVPATPTYTPIPPTATSAPATPTNTPVLPTATSLPATATSAPAQTYSLWNTTATPAVASVNDPNAIELGVKFRADADGYITGLRFYKGSFNTGTHVGHLWTASGTLLGQVTFTDETASGWQTAYFATPVPVSANTTYVASYHTDAGYFSMSRPYFVAGYRNGLLYAPASSEAGGNGVYRYGPSAFPNQSYEASNYWVDVVFTTSATAPTATSAPATPTNTPVPPTPTATATALPATATPTPTPTSTPTNTPVPVTATPTNTPTSTPAPGSSSSLWNDTAVPAFTSVNDPNPVELGVKFRADADGYITGLRFYKGSFNTGTHVGHLWTASGTLLGQVTFTDETASGWQTAYFATPVPVSANTTYVASYHTDAGYFSMSRPYFVAGYRNGLLYAPASSEAGGNGVYRYGPSAFPNQSYEASNYWVDIIFTR